MIFMLLSILGLNPSIMINSRNQLPYRNGADIETSNYFRGQNKLTDDEVLEDIKKTQVVVDKKELNYRRNTIFYIFLVINITIVCIFGASNFEVFITDDQSIKNLFYYLFLGGLYNQRNNNFTYVKFSWGYYLIYVLCLLEFLSIYWLSSRFGATDELVANLETLLKDQDDASDLCKQLEDFYKKQADQEEKLKKKANDKRISTIMEEDEFADDTMSRAQETLLPNVEKSANQLENEEKRLNELESQLQTKLNTPSYIQINRAFKTVTEDVILLLLWSSALFKMNAQSLIDISLIIYFLCKGRNQSTLRKLMFIQSIVWFVRLITALSNLDEKASPMRFPARYRQDFKDPDLVREKGVIFPWLYLFDDFRASYKLDPPGLVYKLSYWFTLVNFSNKLPVLTVDFVSIALCFVYLRAFQHWTLNQEGRELRVVASDETVMLLKEYMELKGVKLDQRERGWTRKSLNTSEFRDLEETVSMDFLSDQKTIETVEELKNQATVHSWYKSFQFFCNVYYPLLMIMLIQVLAIMGNTLFSLGYIILLSYLMFRIGSFLDIKAARTSIKSFLSRILQPYMIVEITLIIIFQLPIEQFQKGTTVAVYMHDIGIEKYYEFDSQGVKINSNLIGQLWCKAFAFFFVSLQIEIIESGQFQQLQVIKRLGELKGKAMNYYQNNIKLNRYFTVQETCFVKEVQMADIKAKVDGWKDKFVHKPAAVTNSKVDFNQSIRDPSPSLTFESNSLLNVNLDYLTLRKTSVRARKFTINQNSIDKIVEGESSEEDPTEQPTDTNIFWENMDPEQANDFIETNPEKKKEFKARLKQLPWYVKFYLTLRRQVRSPPLDVSSLKHMRFMLKDMENGEVKGRSDIETAVLRDMISESLGKPAYCLKNTISGLSMVSRFFYLLFQSITQNVSVVTYALMVYLTVRNPGFMTLIYPVSLFGYAALKESGPSRSFWYAILLYTQSLMIIEFTMVIFSEGANIPQFREYLEKYYLGLSLPKDDTVSGLFSHFHPLILFSLSVIVLIQSKTILNDFEEHETIEQAYPRYVKGQYGVIVDQSGVITSKSLQRDIWLYTHIKKARCDDELELEYLQTEDIFEDDALSDGHPDYHSEPDTAEQDPDSISKTKALTCKGRIEQLFLTSSFIEELYPLLKIAKPGVDLYTWIVVVQAIIAIYIFAFFNQMEHSEGGILEQVQRNLLSGQMVLLFTLQVIFMVIERVIYKCRRITYQQNEQNQILTEQKIKLAREIAGSPEIAQEPSRDTELVITGFTDQLAPKEKQVFSDSTLIAKSAPEFKNIIQVYYLWFLIFFWTSFSFFWFPMTTNYDKIGQISCDTSNNGKADGGLYCNYMQRNTASIIFYLLICLYFALVCKQIRVGMPEIQQANFPMQSYSSINRYILLGYMNVPFLLEMKMMIDWMVTRTSLDLFQWIKVAQVQADLFKARATADAYYAKKLGERQPPWAKVVFGLLFLLGMLVLVIGPLWLFSTLINQFLVANPISNADITVSLSIKKWLDVNPSFYQLVDLNSYYKLTQNLTDDEYDSIMNFNSITSLKEFHGDQTQLLIMNQPTNIWLMVDKRKQEIKETLDTALNSNYTEGATDYPKEISFQLDFNFDRQFPSSAMKTTGSQNFTIFRVDEIVDGNVTTYNYTRQQSLEQLTKVFGSSSSETINVNVTDPGIGGFDNLLMLDTTKLVTAVPQDDFEASSFFTDLYLQYTNNPGKGQEYWELREDYDDAEWNLINERTDIYVNKEQMSVAMFIFSRKKFPEALAFLSGGIFVVYISFVYLAGKSIRSGMVPLTSQIVITDARNPHNLLKMIESIQLYRLMGDLKKEEELFYLLIDILRNPVVFKAICGDSTREGEDEEQSNSGGDLATSKSDKVKQD